METTSSHAGLVAAFLENACHDPILANGPGAHARRSRTAARMLERYPEIAHDSIHTATVCGDLDEVKRILAARPGAATEPGGPLRKRQLPAREKLWTPLLHLCYGRLPSPAARDNAVAIARALLDHGANPNDFFEVGSFPCRYTTLCGVAGEGEDNAPPHPRREELARLLLDRGAEPYDTQLFYNTHFHGDMFWSLKLIYDAAVRAGRQSDWEDPNWSMINMGGYGSGARYFLGVAVTGNNLELAEWILNHGASPNPDPPPHEKAPKHSLHEEALRRGFTDMADLLVRFGATPETYARTGLEDFATACFSLDGEAAKAALATHPEYLRSPIPMHAAAERDRADVVAFLLDLGVSIEVENKEQQRPLHIAAFEGSLRVARLLVERGAAIDPVESTWNNTPLDAALYANRLPMVEFLSGVSSDVFLVTFAGNISRLRELLAEEPALAKAASSDGTPLLMWLPDDESRATEIAKLLIAHGAEPAFAGKKGNTAADRMEGLALYDLAEMLRG